MITKVKTEVIKKTKEALVELGQAQVNLKLEII